MQDSPGGASRRTLREVTWPNSTLISADVTEEIARLKQQPGGDIGVHGSAGLVRSLLRNGLLDELKLAVFPAIAGEGQRLFADLGQAQALELIDADRTGAGVMVLTYRPRPD